jgi:hypothetical protein
MKNGIDRALRFWPIVLFILAVVAVAAEVRLSVAGNEGDIAELRAQQQHVEDALRQQAAVNGRIDERTLNIQAQLNLVIQQLREAARRADGSGR